MTIHNISDFDIFFLSYDEPNCEENWHNLQNIAPWAKRVHKVKGFDSAHKACANQSETDRFITVDGDNIVYPEFFDVKINIPPKYEKFVLSWAARNIINGLVYGNGGVKLWTKDFVLKMRTHENAVSVEEKVDFCWADTYLQMNNIYSDTCPNASPLQAFKAGFREGCKMTLDKGRAIDGLHIKDHSHWKNFQRLMVWASLGADAENGVWAIYGTRLGIYKTHVDKTWDVASISDFDWFDDYFKNEIQPQFAGGYEFCPYLNYRWDMDKVISASGKVKEDLNKNLGLWLADFNVEQSIFFKKIYTAPRRNFNPMLTEFEVDNIGVKV